MHTAQLTKPPPWKKTLTSPALWVGVVAVVIAVPLLRPVLETALNPLQKLGEVPAFALTDQSGHPFGTEQLKGKVWVANFIFTRCPNVCPTFSAKMASVQDQSATEGEGLALVSFTVDPDYDTPERLTAYGEKYHRDPARWAFLTGTVEQLKAVVVGGLHQAMDRGADDDLMSYAHGGHFVLVDQLGRIRGYYGLSDPASPAAVLRDAKRLLAGEGVD